MNPRVQFPVTGKIERFDPALDAILPLYAQLEVVAQGFEWAEGPVWVERGNCLLFSDTLKNVVYRWDELRGAKVWIKPSGYTGPDQRAGEPGSNGLALDPQGRLVLCQHGDRRVARWEPSRRFQTLAGHYKFLRFNSPNDLVYRSNGDLYFTDPTYGLEGGEQDPKRELMFAGVYRLTPGGEVTLLTDKLKHPNGIAFSPDERLLYVAVSDAANPVIMAYGVKPDGTLDAGRVFFDAKPLSEGRKGVPDGLKVDLQGNLFATGPGGLMIISPAGKLLGIVHTPEQAANCAWGNAGNVLYITADSQLLRLRTWTRGFVPDTKK